jgi:D-alanyl-D-alanine carboxypeptidase
MMDQFLRDKLPLITAIMLPLVVLALGAVAYLDYRNTKLTEARFEILEEQLAIQKASASSTAASLERTITVLAESLALTKEESFVLISSLSGRLSTEQQRVNSLQEQTSQLEKLNQIDEELLMKYSKVYFLNENYVPSDLSEIKNEYLYSEQQTQYFHSDALPFLVNMLEAAEASGKTLYVKSAYRSFNEQDNLKGAYSVIYGQGTANQFSADQGYSEHQLGTTVDLITTGFGGELLTSFENTDDFWWLHENAYKYGFILSYPRGNAYYVYEPWHWRFVGKALAKHLHETGKHFYDMDQRKIDEYLISIFDN